MYLDYLVNPISASLTLAGFAVAIILFVLYLTKRRWLVDRIGQYTLSFLLFVSLLGTFGSLLYSGVLGYLPCYLCWWQRIFLYAQPVIFFAALYKKTKVGLSALLLSLIGGSVALYHYLLQIGLTPEIGCAAAGPQCSEKIVLGFGFVTIPLMALSGFLLLVVLSLIQLCYETRSPNTN